MSVIFLQTDRKILAKITFFFSCSIFIFLVMRCFLPLTGAAAELGEADGFLAASSAASTALFLAVGAGTSATFFFGVALGVVVLAVVVLDDDLAGGSVFRREMGLALPVGDDVMAGLREGLAKLVPLGVDVREERPLAWQLF